MNFLHNIHTVPLTDLLTFNTAIILAIVYSANKYYEYDMKTCLVFLVILLIINVIIHPYFGIPENLSRFVGLGERPIGWRGI